MENISTCKKAKKAKEITFGKLIEKIEGVAFVYYVSVTTALGTRYYIGSKAFRSSPAWQTYHTSSKTMHKLLAYAEANPDRMQIRWHVLEQVKDSRCIKARESWYINSFVKSMGMHAMINIASPTGQSLRTGKSLRKRCKNKSDKA